MIELINLSKKYSNNKELALTETTLTIPSGKIVGFIGHNGAGKSTTLNCIIGTVSPTTGDVLINGHSIKKNAIKAKQQFGYVSDSPNSFLKLTGYQYLNFIANIFKIEPMLAQERINKLADDFIMSDNLSNNIDSYSHGMRQKIFVMAALLHEPEVFILDEPLTGLDPQGSRILKDAMKEHAQKGKTVLFSTHVLEVAEKFCDEVIIINKGKIIYQGEFSELKRTYPSDYSLEDIFFKVVENNG